MASRTRALLPCLTLLAACGGDDFTPPETEDTAHVAGTYTVAVVNHENGCTFDNWTEGATTTAIPVTLYQDDTRVSGTVDGLAGAFFALWIGSNTLVGDVEGTAIQLAVIGTNHLDTNGCSYTVIAEMHAQITGDAIQGDILYRTSTPDVAACAEISGCTSKQAFSGTRPPQ